MAAALALVAAGAAHKLRALTSDGAVATAIIGFVVYGWGGAGAALPLLLFFSSATVLTKLTAARRREKTLAGRDVVGDASGRRASQVLANGAVPAATIIGFALTPAPYWVAAFAGALAAVAADTWATEIGALSKRAPVLITTRKRVEPGQSGAVSLVGTLGGVTGALTLALGTAGSFALWPLPARGAASTDIVSGAWIPWPRWLETTADGVSAPLFALPSPPALPGVALVVAATAGGIIGLFADSLLGATVQARFYCISCKVDTEQSVHRCGSQTQHVSGIRFLSNDIVNLATSVVGAISAAVVFAASIL